MTIPGCDPRDTSWWRRNRRGSRSATRCLNSIGRPSTPFEIACRHHRERFGTYRRLSRLRLGGPLHGNNEMKSEILESASLQVRPGQSAAFEAAFREAQAIISSMPGYRSHELQRCLEREGHYLLLVRWESVAAHEEGFRKSPQYQQWKKLLHHFYDPFPTVLHYEQVESGPD